MRDLRNQRPAESGISEGYAALREGTALVEHESKVLLGLSGKDPKDPSGPTGLLAAILTNEIPTQDDLGVYGLLLDAKGHVQTDLRVLKRPDGVLVATTEVEGAGAAQDILGRYAPFSRVRIEDLSSATPEPYGILGVYGPKAYESMRSLTDLTGEASEIEGLAEHQTVEITPPGSDAPILIAGVHRPGVGYDLIGPLATLHAARESLLESGAVPAPAEAYEAWRIQSGLPRFGPDLTPENFPGEAGILDRAVSFAKGCYPGQETVARMHYRGHPNRALYRLSVEAREEGAPEPGSPILQDGKEVGRLTSLSRLGDGSALGYLHRKADPASPLECENVAVHALYAV